MQRLRGMSVSPAVDPSLDCPVPSCRQVIHCSSAAVLCSAHIAAEHHCRVCVCGRVWGCVFDRSLDSVQGCRAFSVQRQGCSQPWSRVCLAVCVESKASLLVWQAAAGRWAAEVLQDSCTVSCHQYIQQPQAHTVVQRRLHTHTPPVLHPMVLTAGDRQVDSSACAAAVGCVGRLVWFVWDQAVTALVALVLPNTHTQA